MERERDAREREEELGELREARDTLKDQATSLEEREKVLSSTKREMEVSGTTIFIFFLYYL